MASIVLRGSAQPVGKRQLCGVARQRRTHQVETGQDQTTAKQPCRIEQIHGGRGSGADYQARAVEEGASADQRRPAVGTKLPRQFVATSNATGFGTCVQERDLDLTPGEERRDARRNVATRDVADHDACRQRPLVSGLSQPGDVGSCQDPAVEPFAAVMNTPLDAAVARVDAMLSQSPDRQRSIPAEVRSSRAPSSSAPRQMPSRSRRLPSTRRT
jgi:hypothetical protein